MSTEALNLRQCSPISRGTYEVWYLTWNHPGTGQGFWLRYVLEAPDHGPARGELWFARFDPRAPRPHVRRPSPLSRGRSSAIRARRSSSRSTRAGSVTTHTFGAFDGDGPHDRVGPALATRRGRSRSSCPTSRTRSGIGETAVASPNPRVAMTGSLVVDGERLSFDKATLGQTHVWGKLTRTRGRGRHCADFARRADRARRGHDAAPHAPRPDAAAARDGDARSRRRALSLQPVPSPRCATARTGPASASTSTSRRRATASSAS